MAKLVERMWFGVALKMGQAFEVYFWGLEV
jgi:hypothetical protein